MSHHENTAHACRRDAWDQYPQARSPVRRRLAIPAACGAVAALCLAAPPMTAAQDADLRIRGITWDVIGLDHNKPETEGPNQFPVAARVKNCGTATATDVIVQLELKPGGNPYISIDGRDTITTPSLLPGQVADFYFMVEIQRTDQAFSQRPDINTKPYQIHVSWKTEGDPSGTVQTASTSPNRQLFVEQIISQNRNTVDSITVDGDPTVFLKGQIRTFTLLSQTATGYEQQETTINFPTEFFQILSVRADYEIGAAGGNFLARTRSMCDPNVITNVGAPGESPEPLAPNPPFWTNNKVYADGCGWVNNYFDPEYHQNNMPCFGTSTRPLYNGEQELTTEESYDTGKVGGRMITTYKVLVLDNITTSVRLSFLVHDQSGSSYHYGYEEDIFVIEPTNILVAKTAFPETVEAGTTFTYTITVMNDSANPADDVVLTDTLPACIDFVSADPPPVNPATNPLRWNIGTLGAGESKEFEIIAVASCTTGDCVNTAEVSTTDHETTLDDNISTAAITIVDTTPPAITCPPDATLECPVECVTPECLGTATATDLCGTATVTSSDSFETSCGATGTLTRVWTATDASGNQSSCTQTIWIVDTTPPMITCPPDTTVDCTDSTSVEALGTATAVDDCDPDVVPTYSDSVTSDDCTTTITRTWTAVDNCGNKAQCVQIIVVRDTTPPMLTCPADITVPSEAFPSTCTVVMYPTVIAVDACNDVTVTFDPPSGTCFLCGTTNEVLVMARDTCGNTSICTFTVTIEPCQQPPPEGCALTQGFWKNHPDAWPVDSLTLGNVSYSKDELLRILNQPVRGNGLVSLAYQLIAAKLNILSGADPSCIQATIDAADMLIGDNVIPPIGSNSVSPGTTSPLTGQLDDYNNGRLCVPHCDSLDESPDNVPL